MRTLSLLRVEADLRARSSACNALDPAPGHRAPERCVQRSQARDLAPEGLGACVAAIFIALTGLSLAATMCRAEEEPKGPRIAAAAATA